MAKLDKYVNLVNNILDMVGGNDNITLFTHCVTRLRFNVKDKGLVDLKAIEKTEGVIGVQWSGDQLQIIVGQNVGEVYSFICKTHGLKKEAAVNEDLDGVKKEFSVKGIVTGVVDGIAGCFTPLIPMLCGGGMIRVVAMFIQLTGVLPADNPTYMILTWMGDAFLYFLPVFVGYSAAKKFGASQPIAMLLGAFLLHPSFTGAISAGTALTMFGLPVYAASYKSTVFPIILTVWVLSKIEKVLKKYTPEMFMSMLVPLLSLLIMLPVMLCITGPAGFYLGTYVSAAIIWLYETFGFIGIALFALVRPFVVMTGMHLGMTSYWISAFSSLGYEPFYLGCGFIGNFCQGAACLAVALKAKTKNLKSTAMTCAISAIVPGITEPAMFAVTLRLKKPMYAAMIGGCVGSALMGLLGVVAYALPGSAALFGLPVFIGPNGNLIKMVISILVAMVVAFIAAWMLGFEEEAE